ncbi:hypothetical protein [Nitrosomonas sp.]|uniref:hypothetical protein n=1 Tax=Nitrosomonas sp. TaxID=42353 RepID=UPI0020872224|nr:hypothetical protein [Nitrosomonas sp.]GJL75544.1 MAG: hypothetical protein NMNS02_16500 [Nitrosomonas sp.]
MSQLHCYVPDDVAKKLQAKAEQAHLPVSKYLALLIEEMLKINGQKTILNCLAVDRESP